jgi:hypothetical protein
MKHLNSTTRLFVGLLVISLLLTYVSLVLSRKQLDRVPSYNSDEIVGNVEGPQALLNTTGWKSYQDRNFPLAFSYPKDWTVFTDTKDIPGFYKIGFTPKDSINNVSIYISDKSYLGFDGLEQSPYLLKGNKGIKIDDYLIGVKAGDYYYTFDASKNENQLKEFTTMLSTVEFK